jgi:hypothetical protein
MSSRAETKELKTEYERQSLAVLQAGTTVRIAFYDDGMFTIIDQSPDQARAFATALMRMVDHIHCERSIGVRH